MSQLYACLSQKVKAILDPVKVGEDHSFYARLYDELAAFHAGRSRHVKSGSIARIVAAGHLSDGICLGVQHVWLGDAIGFFSHILKARWSTVVAVRYYH